MAVPKIQFSDLSFSFVIDFGKNFEETELFGIKLALKAQKTEDLYYKNSTDPKHNRLTSGKMLSTIGWLCQ